MQTVKLRSRAWYGDSPYELDFPDEWQVSHIQMPAIAALTRAEIQAKINAPIGQKTLNELASGRKSAIIIVDDLTRPTPVEIPLRIVFDELVRAGIPTSQIQILMAGGTHQASSQDEIRRKIGVNLPPETRVLVHNFNDNLKYLGKTPNLTPVFINQAVMDADLKIGIGGIYPHPNAGFSGGAKIIAPATAGMDTIRFLHANFQNSRVRGDDVENGFRHECEEVARMVGLDFIVNLALNQDRDIAGVFAGNFVAAHRQGAAAAQKMYTVTPVSNADIIITDAYPFDGELQFAYDRGYWPLETGSNEIPKIILATCANGVGSHELFPLHETFVKKVLRKLRQLRWRDLITIPRRVISAMTRVQEKEEEVEIMLVSNVLPLKDFQSLFPAGKLYQDWNAIKVELLSKFAGRQPHVAIYQCAPLLIPKTDDQ
jgi:nickel-dependent lactate racemase